MAQTLTVEDTAIEDLAESGAENVEQTTKRRAKNEFTQKETQAVKRAVNIVYKQLQNSNKTLVMNDVLNALEIKFTNDDSTVGKIDIVEQGEGKLKKGVIHITEEATPKVLIHEIGHFLRANASEEDLRGYRKAYGIDGTKQEEWTKPVSKSLRKQRGITNASANYTYEELFANDFVRYVERGIIPNEEIQSVFDTIKSMLTNIVNNFKGRLSAKTYDTLRETFSGDTAKRQSTLSRVNIDINRAETILKDTTLPDEQRSKWEKYKAKKETARDYLLKKRANNERNLGDTTTLFYTDEEKQERLKVYTVSKEGLTLDKTEKLIKRIRLKNEFKNRETGDTAFLSVKGANKIICNKAVEKSMNNGFTKKQHNEVASKIGELYEYAFLLEKIADRNNDSNILSIKRFVAPIIIGNDIAGAYITVKELKPSKKEKRKNSIYSVEEIKLRQLPRLGKQPEKLANTYGATTLLDKILEEVEKVKDTPTTLFYTEEIKNKFIKLIEDVRLMKGNDIVRNRYKVEKKNYEQQTLKTKYGDFSFEIANKRDILPSEKDIGGFFARENIQVSFLNEQQKLGLKSPDAMLNKKLIIEMKTLNKNVQNLVEATTRNLFNGLKIQNGESLVDVVVISLNDVQTQLNNIGKEKYINSVKEKIQGALSTKETFRKTFNEVWIINNDELIKLKREKGESASINTGILMGGNQHTLLSPSLDYNINDELQNVNKNNTKSFYYTEEEASDVIDRLTDDEATNLVSNAKAKGYLIPQRLAERTGDIDTLNAYADLDNLKLLNGVDYVAKAREYIENLDIKANEETAESNIREVLDKAKEQFIVENATEDTSEDITVYLFH